METPLAAPPLEEAEMTQDLSGNQETAAEEEVEEVAADEGEEGVGEEDDEG